MERSVRHVEARITTIKRDRLQLGARTPSDELFDLARTVDRMAARLNDLDYRARRLEMVPRR